MLQRVSFPSLEESPSFPPFREGVLFIPFVLCLLDISKARLVDRLLLTLIVPGDCGLTSNVANAGALVSPALISPPSPLDLLRIRDLSLLLRPAGGPNLAEVDRRGNASAAVILDTD